MLGLVALWWGVRIGMGSKTALVALALWAVLPVSILYAGLVNYENPCLAPLLFGCAFHVRWLVRGARSDLVWAAVSFLLASMVTFTPFFFVPPLVLQTFVRRGSLRAAAEALALGTAALVPALLHGAWVDRVMPEGAPSLSDRVNLLMGPMFDGAHPMGEWARRQWVRMDELFTLPILLAACAGLLLASVQVIRGLRARSRNAPVSLGLPLFAGGAAMSLAFYQHTWDGDAALNGQTNFLLNLAPACVVLAAGALLALDRPLSRLRGGFAPLVAVVALIGLPSLQRANTIRHAWRDPGPADDPALDTGPPSSLPITAGRQIAEVLPAGAIGLFPIDMGFSLSVSFYAWRTLLGVNKENWGQRMLMIDDVLGLADAERYILFPRNPPPHVKPFVDHYRAILAAKFEPVAQTEHWEIWPPDF